jgi:hypothetical protein
LKNSQETINYCLLSTTPETFNILIDFHISDFMEYENNN